MKKNQRKTSAAAAAVGDFLFEIGCEEIPAGMIAKASNELKAILEKYFSTNGLVDASQSNRSIRRTATADGDCAWRAPETGRCVREVIGPPKSVAFDNLGEPTRAAMSFAEKQGIPVSKLAIVNTPKGEYVSATQLIRRARRCESSR